jgi:hypothetical protein
MQPPHTTTTRRTSRSTFLTTLGIGLSAAATIGSLVTAAPATAAVDGGYHHARANTAFQSQPSYAGAYVDCPAGQRPISTGVLAHDPMAILRSNAVTKEGTGSHATAWGSGGQSFEVSAECVPNAKLSGSTPTSRTVRDRRDRWGYFRETVACPSGSVAYGGGGTVTDSAGNHDQQGLNVYGSIPGIGEWTYAAAGGLGSRVLRVDARCLPRTQLGRVVHVDSTVTGPPNSTSREPVVASARCPANTFAFAGGAWFHTSSTFAPSWHGYLRASAMDADGRGWFAAGTTFGFNSQLTTRVLCTDRLGR